MSSVSFEIDRNMHSSAVIRFAVVLLAVALDSAVGWKTKPKVVVAPTATAADSDAAPVKNTVDGCSVNVKTEFGNPSPLPLHHSRTHPIWSPAADGSLHIPSGDSIDLFCSERFADAALGGARTLTVSCLHDRSVHIVDSDAPQATNTDSDMSALSCTAHVKSTLVVDRAVANVTYARIGFQLPEAASADGAPTENFVGLITLAYDNGSQRALYAHHRIGAGLADAQLPDARIAFRKDGLFACDSALYERETQRSTICERQLAHTSTATGECERYFGTAQKYLARGHLAPSADFEYRAEQRATFSLANVAPQWQSINNGQWKALETAVRKLAVQRPADAPLDIVTGTMGVLQLPDRTGAPRRVSLEADGQIPVPAAFFKVVVDRAAQRAVVLVVSNDPTVRTVAAAREERVCEDVGERLAWAADLVGGAAKAKAATAGVGGRGRRPTRAAEEPEADVGEQMTTDKGFMYACAVAEFVRKAGVEVPEWLRAGTFELLA